MQQFKVDYSKSGTTASTLSLLEAGRGTLLRSKLMNLPFLSPDSSTRSEMQVSEGVQRQVRVQSLVPCICVHQRASDCFKLSWEWGVGSLSSLFSCSIPSKRGLHHPLGELVSLCWHALLHDCHSWPCSGKCRASDTLLLNMM